MLKKKILITGHTSKIVIEFIKLLNINNFKIITCGRSKFSDIKVDLSKINQIKKFILKINKIKPDYIFLNHGHLDGKKTYTLNPDAIQNSFNVNLLSNILILENFKKIKNTKIVITSSISGGAGSFDTLYSACKSGLNVVAKYYSKQIHSSSRINLVSPGIISDAQMTLDRKDFIILKQKKNETPTKKFTTSKEVAMLVFAIFFNLDNLNGENIHINGGIF